MAWKTILGWAWSGTKSAAKGAAGVAHVAKNVVVNNKQSIATVVGAGVSVAGYGLKAGGKGISSAAGAVAGYAHAKARSSESKVGKAFAYTAALAADTTAATGKAIEISGEVAGGAAPIIGAAASGVAAGGSSILSEALDAAVLTPSDIQPLRDELSHYGDAIQRKADELQMRIARAQAARRKEELLDLLVVGGVTLAAIRRSPGDVPPMIEQAFAAAYPDLSIRESFGDVVDRLDASELPGLVAGVKGKLFELQLVEYLNGGILPAGQTASIAESSTQPGWDIRIMDANGGIVEVIQAKATESVDYVREALERYPGIDVTTTSEVYAQLAALGAAEGVRDSGISEAALESAVLQASNGGDLLDASDLVPSAVGLAVIGLSVFMDRSMSHEQRAEAFGERTARASVATVAGQAVMLTTQMWWIGLVAGAGTGWLATKGRAKREQLESLRMVLTSLRSLERRQMTPAGGPSVQR